MSKILVRHMLYINTLCYPPNKNNTRPLPSAIAFLYVVQYMFATLTYSINNSFHTALLSPCFASRLRATRHRERITGSSTSESSLQTTDGIYSSKEIMNIKEGFLMIGFCSSRQNSKRAHTNSKD